MKSLVDLIIDMTNNTTLGKEINELMQKNIPVIELKQCFSALGYNINEEECSTILNSKSIFSATGGRETLSY